jgi:DNA-binding response OmpR family regulator
MVSGSPGPITILICILVGLVLVAVFGAVLIRARLRRIRAQRRRLNPYEAGRPILDPNRFFGREALISHVLNSIHQNDVLIHGERRIGKTSLLRQLEHQLQSLDDPDYRFIPVYVDIEGVVQAEFFYSLMEDIVATCREDDTILAELNLTEIAATDYSYRDFQHDLQSLLKALQEKCSRIIRLILLLDEVDAMNDYDQLVQQQFRRILMKRFARQVGIVASGVHVFREWSRQESPFRNLFVEIRLGALEEQAARQLVTEPVKGIYDYDRKAVDLVLRYSERKPWYIQRLCLEAISRLHTQGRTRVTSEDIERTYTHIDIGLREQMRSTRRDATQRDVERGEEKTRITRQEVEEVQPSAETGLESAETASAHILIVEDDTGTAEMLSSYFKTHGYEASAVAWGGDALAFVESTIPDLILLDIRLPDIDGYEVCRRLRENRRTAQIPVIFLTERRERGDKLRGLELGAADYITKPFDIQVLRLKVRNVLRRSQSDRIFHPITGLPDAKLSGEQLQELVDGSDWAILSIRLHGLDEFADTYGSVARDDVVRAVALMLNPVVSKSQHPDAFAGHFDDDTLFVTIAPNEMKQAQDALEERLNQALEFFFPRAEWEAAQEDPTVRLPRLEVTLKAFAPSMHTISDLEELMQAVREAYTG